MISNIQKFVKFLIQTTKDRISKIKILFFREFDIILNRTLLNLNQHPLIYTYLEWAHWELSNDTHIDYSCVWTQFFEKLGLKWLKNREIFDRCKYSQYGYRLKALDELIPNMYILMGVSLNLVELEHLEI